MEPITSGRVTTVHFNISLIASNISFSSDHSNEVEMYDNNAPRKRKHPGEQVDIMACDASADDTKFPRVSEAQWTEYQRTTY